MQREPALAAGFLRTKEKTLSTALGNARAGLAPRRWRVGMESAERLPALVDYFRRLGLAPDAVGPLAFELETDMLEGELEACVSNWVNANHEPVLLAPVEHEPAAPEATPAAAQTDLLSPSLLPPPRLGELLVRKGFITDEQLAGALEESRVSRELLGVVLLRKGVIFEEELARTLSQQLSIPYISIMRCGVNQHVARLLPYDVGLAAAAVPVRGEGDAVQVAFADPTDPAALAAVRERIPNIVVAVAELSDIRSALRSVSKPFHS
jgi:type II secretion system (T2SS) protein E